MPLATPITGFNIVLGWLGAATMVIGVVMALVQHDLKRLLAYHSVSQMGYVVVGLSLGTPLGVMAGLFHALNHSLFKGLLFLGAGSVEHATGTRNLDELGGLAKFMPVTAATMFIASLSISGVPLFNGFSSKWLIYEACIQAGQPLLAVVGMLVSAWTLISFMKVMHSAFFGLPSKTWENIKESPLLMVIPMVILAALCILFGVLPELPIQSLLAPAAAILTPGVPLVGLYPIYTQIGVWGPTYATLLAIIGLIIGYVIYKVSLRRPPEKAIATDKFLPFTGGLVTPPYLKVDKAHVPSSPFSFAADPVTKTVKRIHTGLINHYFIWIILFFFIILLIFTIIGG
jgi:formate hydrogenlyase subunit 3/multisubunit Na+/H+ antiporter MnhD subunit